MSNLNKFDPDDGIITLIDEEGTEYNFELLDSIDYKGRHFIALMPLNDHNDEKEEVGELMLFETAEEDDEEIITAIEDEKLASEVEKIFKEHLSEIYDFEE